MNRQDTIREIIKLRKKRNWNNRYGFIIEYLKEHFKIMENDIREFKIKEGI